MSEMVEEAAKVLSASLGIEGLFPMHADESIPLARAAILAALDAVGGEVIRAAILSARSGDGQELLRSDMPWCAPEASAGLIGAAVIRALRNELLSPQGEKQ